MKRNEPIRSAARAPSYDVPQADGERLVSGLRIVLAAVIVLFVFGYVLHSDATVFLAFHWSGVLALLWALSSALYLVLIRRGRYRPWMSYASTAMDIFVFSMMLVALVLVLPLQFIHGPVPMMFFLVIGLAALRRSRRLVIFAGVASGLVYLGISLAGTAAVLPAWQWVVELEGQAMGINAFDQVVKALMMAVAGVIIGHVTGQLRRSEHRYQDLFEHVPDGIVIVGPDQRIVTVNVRFADMVGRDPDSLSGSSISEFLTHGPLGRATPPAGMIGSPTTLVRADSSELPVRSVSVPVTYQGLSCVEMSVRDVAQQVELQRQLAQSQKMETVGRLGAGLARDFSDIIDGIIGAAARADELARRVADPRPRERLEQQIAMIRECAGSAHAVVGRLIGFSRTETGALEPLDLGRLVTDVAGICRNTFDDRYDVREETTSAPARVEGDGTALTQALLNLCINARDAMPAGGAIELRVSAAKTPVEHWLLPPGADPTGSYWCVEVTDTGMGMDRDTMDKIFDPFFTTKPAGQGTGLGLSMVYNIVRQHRGFIDVRSRLGAGTTFQVYLERALPRGGDER